VYNHFMAKEVIHISEAEAATTNVATLLAHVRAGAEVVIENGARPVAVLRSLEPHPGRLLSESIALAEAHAKELGYEPTLDAEFAADLEEIINSRKPRNVSTWEQSSTLACSLQGSVAAKVCGKSSSECKQGMGKSTPHSLS